jgi:hypothetical protein
MACNHVPAVTLGRHRPSGDRGGTLILALLAAGSLMMIAANVMQITGTRLATVAQSSSWQKAYYLAESGVDIARNALRAACEDPTIWTTQAFPASDGTTAKWSPADASTFPKTVNINMPTLADDGSLVSTVQVTIDCPSGAGTINPGGLGQMSSRCFRIRSIGNAEIPGPTNISHDPVEINLRKISWVKDWRTGASTTGINGGPRASRLLEVVVRPVSPFAMAILADEKIELKKGKDKLVDSWNTLDADAGQRKYLKPDSDKWKGARDVGNIGANGVSSKNKPIKDAIRIEGTVIWGNVYAAKADQVTLKPTPAKLTDVIKGGQIVDGFYMKLDPVTPAASNPSWAVVSSVQTVNPDSTKAAPLFLDAGLDPNNPPKIKFTKMHLHKDDKIIIKPAVNASGVVQPKSYIDIWVAHSMRIHKGGMVMLGQGVVANIIVDKCIHIESASKVGGIQYANFELDGAGKLKADSSGKPKYVITTVDKAVDDQFATPSNLTIYGGLAKNKRSHAKISAELMGSIYAPKHDFTIKMKDGTYNNIYGSVVGRRFKIEGKTRFHYDEALRNHGVATDFEVASVVEDWYDRSAN